MFNRRVGVLALALAWVTGCGEEFVASSDAGSGSARGSGTTMTSSSSSVAGQGGAKTTSGAGSTGSEDPGPSGGAGGSSTATTSASGGAGGAAGFQATCSGTVDCPDMAACADWQYDVDDDGTTTVVKAAVAALGMTCSDQVQYATTQDAGLQVTGNIMFPCDTQTWSFGIDRQTQLVYVKEMTMGYSWTPPCE